MRRPIVGDRTAAERLRREGWFTTPLLDAGEVEMVRSWCRELHGSAGSNLEIGYTLEDRRVMARTSELVRPVLERHLSEVFDRVRPVFLSFVVKHPGGPSSMFLHDDRCYVDPRQHRAAALWIPLVDVGPGIDNGGLAVVPGSVPLTSALSGTATPEPFRAYERELLDALVPVALGAGEAAVYDPRLLHASPDNTTDRPREALVCVVVAEEAPLVHVVAGADGRRRIYAVDDAVFVRHHPSEMARALAERQLLSEAPPERALDPALVAEVLGLERPPAPRPVVPADLAASVRRVVPGLGELDERAGPDAGVLTVDAGGRSRIEVDELAAPVVRVLDAPCTRAGMVVDGDAFALECGRSVSLPAPSPIQFWNDGPSPLVVALQPGRPSDRPLPVAGA